MRPALEPRVFLRQGFEGVIILSINQVTQILEAARQGDPEAADPLLPLGYGGLQLAASTMANEAAGHTLQPTALAQKARLFRELKKPHQSP